MAWCHIRLSLIKFSEADTLTIPLKYMDEWCDLLEKVQQDLLNEIERTSL